MMDIFLIETHSRHDSVFKGFDRVNIKKALLASIIGALSTIPGEIITRIMVSLGVGKYDVYQLNSLVATIDEPSIIMGMIINFIVGGFVAILLYLLLEKIAGKFILIINIGASLLVWFVFESAFTAFFEGLLDVYRPISDHYVHLVATTIYGITQGLLFKAILFKKV
jgi:undecaprenyl pyrophosphate phosphatase UppP